jgi:phospholipid/cholesterol/gamma-HCH transport system substrate-binding protein
MSKSNDVFSEVIVGVFMVAVLSLLAYFTIVISGVDLVLGRAMTSATVEFPDVGGLKERDSVVYRGMKVGTVDSIALSPKAIIVKINVAKEVVLRDSYRITVASHSLLGGNFLQLDEGVGEPLPLASTTFRGEPPLDWMRDLGEIARNLSDLTKGGGLKGIVTNLEAASEKVNVIVQRVERGEGTIGRLLSTDDTLYRDLQDAVSGAKTTFTNIAVVAERVERGEGTIGKLLSKDDTVYVDLKNTIARASEIADRLAAGEGTIGKLLAKDSTVYDDLKASVANIKEITGKINGGEGLFARLSNDKELSDNAAALLENLKTVSEKLAKGEGTLGKLTTDAELYNEVNALLKDVRQIVDNYRDTTPISSFAGLIGGAL